MLNVRQLRERLGSLDGDLPVRIIINESDVYDVDYALYSLAYESFVLNITMQSETGYYYTDDEYCFYIKHTESKFSIPIQKESSCYIVSDEAIKKMVDYLNERDSNIIFELEDEVKRVVDKVQLKE